MKWKVKYEAFKDDSKKMSAEFVCYVGNPKRKHACV